MFRNNPSAILIGCSKEYMTYLLNGRDYMLIRILSIAGLLIVGIVSFYLLNKPIEVDTAVENKEEQEPLVSKEEELNNIYIEGKRKN